MSQNSDPYSSGLPFWTSIDDPNFPLNATKIWLFFCAAYYVRLKEKTGFTTFLTGFMISLLIIVTSHVALELCVESNLLMIIFSICLPLYRA